MILTADSTVAAQTNRRRTGNGWHTTYIGKNRNTRLRRTTKSSIR